MREILIEELIKELLGPRQGQEETLPEREIPLKEYMTGIIVPYNYAKKDPDPDSENIDTNEYGISEEDDSDNGSDFSTPVEIDGKSKPKSFGLSFFMKGEEMKLEVCSSWGRYKYDNNLKSWKREGNCHFLTLTHEDLGKEIELYNGEDGRICLYSKKIIRKDGNTITISLANKLNYDKSEWELASEKCIFQPSIRINIIKGELGSLVQQKDDVLTFLYRDSPSIARGHMCSAIWKDIDYREFLSPDILWPEWRTEGAECFLTPDIRSEFIPLHPISSPVFSWNENLGRSPELSAKKISETWTEEEIINSFYPLIEGYEKWLENNRKLASLLDDKNRQTAARILKDQEILLERLKTGIDTLVHDKQSRLAFCFANRVIWLQNYWQKKSDFVWHPFQIAFFLLSLEPLRNKESKYREISDLLWIPTGGGKTEAYLGIMAFTMALRRLSARFDNPPRNGAGVSILSRYTLRLLTIQQFRRTLRMITAAEYLRVNKIGGAFGWRPAKCDLSENMIYGSARFSVGIWVGGNVTPNHLRHGLGADGGAIKALIEGKKTDGEPAQIIRCPVCGTWLAVPKSGLPPNESIYLTCRFRGNPEELRSKLKYVPEEIKDVKAVEVLTGGHKDGYVTIYFNFNSQKNISSEFIENNLWDSQLKKIEGLEREFSPARPGYFACEKEPGRRLELPLDFEIYCPNPCCSLNKDVKYFEGVPLCPEGGQSSILEDGLVLKRSSSPFKEGSRIPIPAYTVDEQIYCRCPTIIVSTVDKIARMAYEPKAGSIFGNVDTYNCYYGYHRKNLLPKKSLSTASKEEYSCRVDKLPPPELIVQDELHLIEGPIGSMFGIYESVVDSLIQSGGGTTKYIASTATVKNSEKQINQIFAKNVFQFPAFGLEISDNFFSRKRAWKENWDIKTPGRIYMGIYSPGNGPLTPNIRIWSNIFKTCHENKNHSLIKNFWSLVGYYNSIRELGGGRALYREDIIERLNRMMLHGYSVLDPENVVELSSRKDSTDLPQILEGLENSVERDLPEMPKGIFTTSMFGTGVDIPHLSIMTVQGQPKTTSQYIQATGRIGRSIGGLIITFLKAGRPRDLSHYEMFSSYHLRQHLEVEPVSVSPFSEGTLERAAGPAFVSFLRNFHGNNVCWYEENGMVISEDGSKADISLFIERYLAERLSRIEISEDQVSHVINYFKSQMDRWHDTASSIPIRHKKENLSSKDLRYVEYTIKANPKVNVVLGDPIHQHDRKLTVIFKNAPQSLREIEETIGLEV